MASKNTPDRIIKIAEGGKALNAQHEAWLKKQTPRLDLGNNQKPKKKN